MPTWTDDDNILFPWAIDELESTWNTYWAKPLRFRIWIAKGSKRQEAIRLTYLLRDNARWLNGSARTPVDLLFEELLGQLVVASAYLQREGVEEFNEGLDRPMQRTMGWHAFSRPDLKNLHCIWSQATGQAPEADRERRIAKAKALKRWKAAWSDVERMAAYRLRDPERIEALLPTVQQCLAELEDAIEAEADSW